MHGQHDTMDNVFYNGHNMDKIVCRVRYQQSPVDVYARFLAVDQVKHILHMHYII